jgi:murein L,D-transpeptidase YcbB/YkuD
LGPVARRIVLSIVALTPLSAMPGSDPSPNPFIETLLSGDELVIERSPVLADQILLDLYSANGYRPIWTRPKIEELLRLIGTAEEHGLDPADYNVTALMTLLSRWLQDPGDEVRARAEILLGESLLRYAHHRRHGKVRARELDPDINFRHDRFRNRSVAENMLDALASPSLAGFIDAAAPVGPYYQRLQRWLAVYRAIAAEGGWPYVAESQVLREGDQAAAVKALRTRLTIGGDLDALHDNGSAQFDPAVASAIRRFQQRHGLDADGIVGAQSYAALNVPVEERIAQLRLSLERLRWPAENPTDTLVAVNIPQFMALFIRDGELVWSTRTMVGKHYRQTPVFRGDIAYMEFNPTWTIPPGILRNDTLPAVKRDPNYLASKNIEVIDHRGQLVDPSTVDWNRYSNSVPYTLRQTPGPHNALGTVKFIFPNEHFVFLHDTPDRGLFDQPSRAFSSGCIRIEDPLRLAELLLNEPARYGRAQLQAIVDSRKTQRIQLEPKVNVLILYLTAALGPGGEVVFMKDIYDRDAAVLDALDRPVNEDSKL